MGLCRRRHWAALDKIRIGLLSRNRMAGLYVAIQCDCVTEIAQKTFLKRAQYAGGVDVRGQVAQRLTIRIEQSLVGIISRQQFEQKLVQIEATDQREAFE